jgi:capsular polysaccharide transport system permease protein
MEIEDKGPLQSGALSALDRARIISQALSDAARRSRISARSRRYSGGGFQARRGAALMRWAAAVSFCLIVILPSVATAIYYTFVASDQYVAETRFTVSGGEAPAIDGLGALTGLPAMAVIQDTQIVTNYVESRDALEKLEKKVNIRDLYSTTAADWFSRFDAK